MPDTEFKIGDIVTEIFSPGVYEIIADKDTPWGHIKSGIYPNKGCDFVLGRVDVKEREVASFVHSPKENLKLWKESF